MGNYGFANIMIENQGIFAVLILLLIYLPIIIAVLRPSKYLKRISISMVITTILNVLLQYLFGFKLLFMIGLDGILLICGTFLIIWFVCLVLAFIKEENNYNNNRM